MTRDTTSVQLDSILEDAETASRVWADSNIASRVSLLRLFASGLRDEATAIAAVAHEETGLGTTRLLEEIERAAVNIEQLAVAIADGSFLDIVIDSADDERVLGHHADFRRYSRSIGPVLNFAASNFPVSFSVLGGDTVSALAAGCSVVVKAHPGHPLTSARVAEIAHRAATETGSPEKLVQLIFGEAAGLAALQDARVRAATFTGSLRAGRVLAGVAAARPRPIPFFGELGSLNPVFVLPHRAAHDPATLISELIERYTWSAGQVCTKPGLVFLPVGTLDAAGPLNSGDAQRLLHRKIAEGYAARTSAQRAIPGVGVVLSGDVEHRSDGDWATPQLLRTSIEELREQGSELLEEAFGPSSIIVEYDEPSALLEFVRHDLPGSLTAAVHFSDADDHEMIRSLAAVLQDRVGRLVFNDWTSSMSVTSAQHHGGPWPAATSDAVHSTSVGAAGIRRFLRTVAWQGAPEFALPVELRDGSAHVRRLL